MIRVLVADDHPIVLQGLRRILTEKLDRPVTVGEAREGREVLELVRQNCWDLVVLDISMPSGGGLEILGELKHERPRLPVLVLSIHPEDQYALRVLRAGAAGYLTKESAPEELIKAIQKVLEGGKYVSPSLAEMLADALDGPETARPPHERLSDRELEVMRLLVSGKSVTDAAKELGRSVKTVSTQRTRVLRKMEMKSNVELARYAVEARLFE